MGALSALAHRVLEAAMRSRTTFLGSGLALPGLVSPDSLALAPNLGWRDIPLAELLAPVADLDPVLVANEADLAAFAVAHPLPGVPSGPSSFVLVSGEVGIGAGIVIDHRMLTGAHGWSGEIGHICVDPAGPVCSCGATGCLESYLGRRAFIRRAGLPADSGPADVVRAAREGSTEARRALDEGGAALGRALAAVINTVDIPLVVLGGNVAEVGEELLPAARREMSVRVLQSAWSRRRQLEARRHGRGPPGPPAPGGRSPRLDRLRDARVTRCGRDPRCPHQGLRPSRRRRTGRP